jgi:hypothetical protein
MSTKSLSHILLNAEFVKKDKRQGYHDSSMTQVQSVASRFRFVDPEDNTTERKNRIF